MYQPCHKGCRASGLTVLAQAAILLACKSAPTIGTSTDMHRPRTTAYWGLGVTLALHVLLGLFFLGTAQTTTTAARQPGAALQVTLVAQAPPQQSSGPEQPVSVAMPAMAPPGAPVREQLHYYFPHELDRQLIVLRDRTGEADIALLQPVVMHLFVDSDGRVAAVSFDGDPPHAAQQQLRAAFMTMEFMPGLKQGKAVPSRLKIVISADMVPAEAGSEIRMK